MPILTEALTEFCRKNYMKVPLGPPQSIMGRVIVKALREKYPGLVIPKVTITVTQSYECNDYPEQVMDDVRDLIEKNFTDIMADFGLLKNPGAVLANRKKVGSGIQKPRKRIPIPPQKITRNG
jgi:hypothetical protein